MTVVRKDTINRDVLNRKQRGRSIAIALVLGALVILFYVVTIVKFGPAG